MGILVFEKISGYSRYFVYSDGQVRDTKDGEFRPQHVNSDGYLTVRLKSDEGQWKWFKVHRLVAQAFIPNPENKPEVDHKDTHRDNNTVYINDDGSVNEELSNLRWVTHKENQNNSLTRRHKSEVASGENNSMYGKGYLIAGENHPLYGTHLSEETKSKLRKPKSTTVNYIACRPKYRNKITGHITDSGWLTKWINQGKTTKEEWILVEDN